MFDGLLNWVAPHLCSNCGRVGDLLCVDCKSYIIKHPFQHCIVCEKPEVNGICKKHRVPYSRAWVVGSRQDGLKKLIDSYKFHNARAAAPLLAELLDKRLPQLPSSNTIITAIPTISTHIRQRGYDHMLLITQQLAKRRGLPYIKLFERRENSIQKQANKQERQKQAQRAFRLTTPFNTHVSYLLVDDVITTGATLYAATQLLKEAGAANVWVTAIAHQPLD